MPVRSIARDHDQRVRNGRVHHFLSIREDKHVLRLAGLVQCFESRFREVLARVWQDKVAVLDTELFAPARIEESGIDARHSGDVGIGLGRHIQAAGAGSLNQRQAFDGVQQACAVDVNDMKRRS